MSQEAKKPTAATGPPSAPPGQTGAASMSAPGGAKTEKPRPELPAHLRQNRTYEVVNHSQEEEDNYNLAEFRFLEKPSGVIGSILHFIKGALGAGILSSHVAYMKAGWMAALPLNMILGAYMTYCLLILLKNGQRLCRRIERGRLSYPDIGEAAMATFPNPKVARFSGFFRYFIDIVICMELFGVCSCYQLIIAKTIKQLVEDKPRSSIDPQVPGYPGLRIYLLILAVPILIICMIRHLKWLQPLSLLGNVVIVLAILTTIYYSFTFNPGFNNLKAVTSAKGMFEFFGLIVFSMSCAGVVVSVENNMERPEKFPLAFTIGMSCVVSFVTLTGFFGYVAYQDECDSPITVNFPMTTWPKILKGAIAIMVFITHALNFWVPFNLCFYYIAKRHNPLHILKWEYFYRAVCCIGVSLLAIGFPDINALLGFLGAFCLSNMAFIWPCLIDILVTWHRPGLGKYKWRLYKAIALIAIGLVLMVCGTAVNLHAMIRVFLKMF